MIYTGNPYSFYNPVRAIVPNQIYQAVPFYRAGNRMKIILIFFHHKSPHIRGDVGLLPLPLILII